MRSILSLALVSIAATSCAGIRTATDGAPSHPQVESYNQVVSVSEVDWGKLNPALGDASPLAGTLWGDRNGTAATGFLAKFPGGFSSPPHIHNVTFRAVVIRGSIHNDDPDSAPMWMPAGSFWTQPKGEVHITSAKGADNVALFEIDQGPYLVRSPGEAFDDGERPVNVDASNIVWVDAPGKLASASGVKVAYLWGSLQEGRSNGTFVKLPAGFTGRLHSHGSVFRAVVIKGRLQYGVADAKTLDPGSYFGSAGDSAHQISAKAGEEGILYVRTNGGFDLEVGHE